MATVVTLANLGLLAVLAVTLAVGYAAWENRPRRGAKTLAGFMLAVAILEVTHLLVHVAGPLLGAGFGGSVASVADRLRWVGIASIGFLWFAFVLAYTGREHLVTRRTVAGLLAWPAAVNVLIWLPVLAGLVGVDVGLDVYGSLRAQEGAVYWITVVVAYGLIAVGTAMVAAYIYRTNRLYRRQGAAVLVGLAAAWTGSIVAVFQLFGDFHLHSLQTGFAVLGVAFFWAVFRGGLTDIVPVAQSTVLGELTAGVLVLDVEDRVVDANPMARRLVGADGSLLARDVDDVLADAPALRESIGERDGRTEEVAVRTDVGRRVLSVDITPLTEHGRRVGTAVVMYDITELKRNEQDLELMKRVFGRVLRHNVRNDLSVVEGLAEHLVESLEEEPRESARKIRDVSRSLVETAEKARFVEHAVEVDSPGRNVDVAAVVRELAGDLADSYPDVDVRTDLPAETWVYAHVALELALENVLENAAEHNDGNEPWVAVSIEEGPDRVRVQVEDNGPGIHDHEVAAVQEGTERDLEHGSGIGLHLANWVTTQAGGGLAFERTEAGTRVTLELRPGTAEPEDPEPVPAALAESPAED